MVSACNCELQTRTTEKQKVRCQIVHTVSQWKSWQDPKAAAPGSFSPTHSSLHTPSPCWQSHTAGKGLLQCPAHGGGGREWCLLHSCSQLGVFQFQLSQGWCPWVPAACKGLLHPLPWWTHPETSSVSLQLSGGKAEMTSVSDISTALTNDTVEAHCYVLITRDWSWRAYT